MSDPLREPLTENAKLGWETILFVLGVIAIVAALYFTIWHYEELPEFTQGRHKGDKMVFVPFIPGILLMIVSRNIQNQRRTTRKVILGSPAERERKKKKIFRWKE